MTVALFARRAMLFELSLCPPPLLCLLILRADNCHFPDSTATCLPSLVKHSLSPPVTSSWTSARERHGVRGEEGERRGGLVTGLLAGSPGCQASGGSVFYKRNPIVVRMTQSLFSLDTTSNSNGTVFTFQLWPTTVSTLCGAFWR